MPQPLSHPLEPVPDVVATLEKFADARHVALFHSALERADVGRYSFLTADPTWHVTIPMQARPEQAAAIFSQVRHRLAKSLRTALPGLPPFQGGIAGVIGYEAGRWYERLPTTPNDGDWPYPVAAIGDYDWVIAWDHRENRAWAIVQPESSPDGDRNARGRLNWLLGRLGTSPGKSRTATASLQRSGASDPDRVRSNFEPAAYLAAVERVIRYIRQGDIFQANLSQQLSAPAPASAVALYRSLAAANPAPFAAFYDAGPFQILSASPECFVRLRGREVETRPIKGTRSRRSVPEADLFTRDELRESDKDRAENVMIVDLLRNDLSRVCQPGSIRVSQLCSVETYQTVQHLVSVVCGQLRPDRDFFDILAATFPGGSITGAPKIRAMEIISELERTPRGPYCGTMFYVSVTGDADSSILIRTMTHVDGVVRFPVGGGITAQSDPQAEYEETWHKAAGLLRALRIGDM